MNHEIQTTSLKKTRVALFSGIMGLLLLALVLPGCDREKKHEAPKTQLMKHGNSQTFVSQKAGYKFAFDLLEKEKYTGMLKKMKAEAKLPKKGTDYNHGLLLTLRDAKSGDMVKNAVVTFNITPRTAQGSGPKKLPAKIISGGKMFHYGTAVQLQTNEKPVIQARVRVGQKTLTLPAGFEF